MNAVSPKRVRLGRPAISSAGHRLRDTQEVRGSSPLSPRDECRYEGNPGSNGAGRRGLFAALLVAIAALTYRNTRQLNEDARWVAHTNEVLDLTGEVLLAIVDAETGQRGFLLTGRDEYLEPYNSALQRFEGLLATLK